MKESKVCRRYKDFNNSNFKDPKPFPITVKRLVSYIKYRGRSLTTFHDHLIGLERHPKHGPEWVRQVRNDPEVMNLIDTIDNRIRVNDRSHKTLRSKWSKEVHSDSLVAVSTSKLVYGQKGAICTEVTGAKNKGFRVVISSEVPQPQPQPQPQQPTSYIPPSISIPTPTTQIPSSSSSSSQQPQLSNTNTSSGGDDDFSDVWYDNTFDEEYTQEQQQQQQQQQQQEDNQSLASFGDDDAFNEALMIDINSSAENRRDYDILNSYDFDNLKFSDKNGNDASIDANGIPEDQDNMDYDFDFDLDSYENNENVHPDDEAANHSVVINNKDHDDLVNQSIGINNAGHDDNANVDSSNEYDETVAFSTYINKINYMDDLSDAHSDYTPAVYINQRYLLPKKKVQVVQSINHGLEHDHLTYDDDENALSIEDDYEPVILIKANKKRKSWFLFKGELEKRARQVYDVESSDDEAFIDDSIEGEVGIYDDVDDVEIINEYEGISQRKEKLRKKKSIFIPKERNKVVINDNEAVMLSNDPAADKDSEEEEEEESDDDGISEEMLARLNKSKLFQLYKKRISTKKF